MLPRLRQRQLLVIVFFIQNYYFEGLLLYIEGVLAHKIRYNARRQPLLLVFGVLHRGSFQGGDAIVQELLLLLFLDTFRLLKDGFFIRIPSVGLIELVEFLVAYGLQNALGEVERYFGACTLTAILLLYSTLFLLHFVKNLLNFPEATQLVDHLLDAFGDAGEEDGGCVGFELEEDGEVAQLMPLTHTLQLCLLAILLSFAHFFLPPRPDILKNDPLSGVDDSADVFVVELLRTSWIQ